MTKKNNKHIRDAIKILISLGLPRAQQNERSALCLLALLNLTPGKKWVRSQNPLIGITSAPSHLIHFNGIRFLGLYNAL